MKKDDYRSEFEEHRQKIKLDEEPTVIKTRAELYRKKRKPKKKSRNVMINVIFALFTLIPIIIIAFVIINWYLDSDKNTTAAQDSRVNLSMRRAHKTEPKENNSVTKMMKKLKRKLKQRKRLKLKKQKKRQVKLKQKKKPKLKRKKEG